jgi:acetoin utilization deacetylase AcuC-like enzyme
VLPTLIYSHPACLGHIAGHGHPERPARIEAVIRGAQRWGGPIEMRQAPLASEQDLGLVHDKTYINAIAQICADGGGVLDPDTSVVEASWEAALRAAGAGIAAAAAIEAGESRTAFLAVRPPGHHAHANRALGFCIFNNVAILAEKLIRQGKRVAVVDWDVHHGDGTQDTFNRRSDVLYVSLHQFPFYPGSGWLEDIGTGEGTGSTVNIAVPPKTRGDAYDAAFTRIVIPVLTQFAPDWILVSSGYDAHRADPLAEVELEAEDFGRMAGHLSQFGLPVVVFLEGGYNLEAIEASVAATLDGLAGAMPEYSIGSPKRSHLMVDLAAEVASANWSGVLTSH